MGNKVPLYKLVNQQGKQFVRKYWVNPKDLSNIRDKQRFDTKDAHTNSLGNYTSERNSLHNEIIENIVDSSPLPKKGEKPKVILLMGGAASGKSTIVRNYIEPKYGKGTFGVLNADDIKESLPEYESFIKEDVETAANRVHEESSDISKKTLMALTMEGRNFIYDAVLGNPAKAKKLVNDLKSFGYEVELVGATVDTKDAWNRANKRAFGEEDKEDGSGRYVPEEPFFAGHRGVVETFSELKNEVGDYVLFDNNVPFGEDPILIENNKGVVNKELKDKFEGKRDIVADDIIKKSCVSLIDFLSGYQIIKKAFNENLVPTSTFLKAKKNISELFKSIMPKSSISFTDSDHSSSDINNIMDMIVDNNEFQHYCDAIVQNQNGEILLLQRSYNDDFGAGKWTLPGGKAEQGELLREAVCRELFEECGLECSYCNYSTLWRNEDGSFSHYFWCFVEDYSNPLLESEEVMRYAWVNVNKELDGYECLLDLKSRIKTIFNIPFKGKYLTNEELALMAENKIEKAYTATSLEKSYKKGCLMLPIQLDERGRPFDLWSIDVLGCIDYDDIYNEPGFGMEHEPHVTVLYGFDLEKVTPEHIERLLPEEPILAKIVDVSYFESENYDVLKFAIEKTEQIEKLNRVYRSLPHESKFPDYKPHCTIAYLKKGVAQRYVDSKISEFVNRTFKCCVLEYSYNDSEGFKAKKFWNITPYEKIEKADRYEIGQISKQTGLKKVAPGKWIDPKTGKKVRVDDEGNKQKDYSKIDVKSLSNKQLAEYAKNSSESSLKDVIENSPDPTLRWYAQHELDRRTKEEAVPKEDKNSTDGSAKKPNSPVNKEESKNESKELSKEEIDAIGDYTERGYRNVNWYLRNNEKPDEESQELMDNLTSALKKLPDHKGVVYRGILPTKELDEHLSDFENNIGGEVEFPAYSSTSEDKSRGEKFGNELLFEIKSKTGKSIKNLSKMAHENEVLFDKGSRFKIKKVKKKVVNGRLLSMNVILEQV